MTSPSRLRKPRTPAPRRTTGFWILLLVWSVASLSLCLLGWAWSRQSHSSHSYGDVGDLLIELVAIPVASVSWGCGLALSWRHRTYWPLIISLGGPALALLGSYGRDLVATVISNARERELAPGRAEAPGPER